MTALALAKISAQLEIWRGTSKENGRYQTFDVMFEDGDSVLDGLVQIRASVEPNLAFRYSCFNGNVCKECTVLIDGIIQYACIAKLKPGIIRVEPIPGCAVLRDLMTDTLSRKERF